jgi:hypothetical protein
MPRSNQQDTKDLPDDEPKPPRLPGADEPEPDLPDDDDGLGDLLKPVIA